MKKRQRRTFTWEFKLEEASMVLDKGYSYTEAFRSLEVRRIQKYALLDQLSE